MSNTGDYYERSSCVCFLEVRLRVARHGINTKDNLAQHSVVIFEIRGEYYDRGCVSNCRVNVDGRMYFGSLTDGYCQ